MSTGDWSQAARGIGNLLVTAGMALTEEQEKILFAAVRAVWPEPPAAPAAPAAEPPPGLAPTRSDQPRMMTVTDGIEAGHWYSPEAVREMLAAERERCANACEDSDTFNYYDPGSGFARLIRALEERPAASQPPES